MTAEIEMSLSTIETGWTTLDISNPSVKGGRMPSRFISVVKNVAVIRASCGILVDVDAPEKRQGTCRGVPRGQYQTTLADLALEHDVIRNDRKAIL